MAGKKFRFSLEPVLALRRQAAERAERALAATLRERQDRQRHFDDADENLRALASDGALGPDGTPASFRRFAAMQQDGFRARSKAQAALEAAQQSEDQARRALVTAKQPEEALDMLQAHEEKSHRAKQQHAERNALDDQATAAYCRQRTGRA